MNKNENDHTDDIMNELNQQLERGNLFTHASLTRLSARINESESFIYAIIDLLVQKGVLNTEEITEYVQKIRKESMEKAETVHPDLALRVDGEGDDNYTPVNCQERWPVCKAICCKLNFALNATEVEDGHVQWDMGHPYFIRHKKNGFCTHLNQKSHGCGVYHNRPAVCKKYTCANDTRIWKNFEKMELNHEWIDTHLQEPKFKLVDTPMFTDQKIIYKNADKNTK